MAQLRKQEKEHYIIPDIKTITGEALDILAGRCSLERTESESDDSLRDRITTELEARGQTVPIKNTMQHLTKQELSEAHIGKQVTFETRQYNHSTGEYECTGEYKTGIITHYRPELPIPCYLVEVDGDTYPWCVNKEMIQENPR